MISESFQESQNQTVHFSDAPECAPLQANSFSHANRRHGELRCDLLQAFDYHLGMAVIPVIVRLSTKFLQMGQDHPFRLQAGAETAEVVQQGRLVEQGAAASQPYMGEHAIYSRQGLDCVRLDNLECRPEKARICR